MAYKPAPLLADAAHMVLCTRPTVVMWRRGATPCGHRRILNPARQCRHRCLLAVLQPTDFFDVESSGYTLDFWAFGLILALSVLLCWGIKETKMFNNGGALRGGCLGHFDTCGCLGSVAASAGLQ